MCIEKELRDSTRDMYKDISGAGMCPDPKNAQCRRSTRFLRQSSREDWRSAHHCRFAITIVPMCQKQHDDDDDDDDDEVSSSKPLIVRMVLSFGSWLDSHLRSLLVA